MFPGFSSQNPQFSNFGEILVNFASPQLRMRHSIHLRTMERTTLFCRLRPPTGVAQCIRFYGAVRMGRKPKNTSQRSPARIKQEYPPYSEKTWRPREFEHKSFRSDGADKYGESAERKRMSAEFAEMRQEEWQRFPEPSMKSRLNPTTSIKRSSTTNRFSNRERNYDRASSVRRDDTQRFPITSSNLRNVKPTRSFDRHPPSITPPSERQRTSSKSASMRRDKWGRGEDTPSRNVKPFTQTTNSSEHRPMKRIKDESPTAIEQGETRHFQNASSRNLKQIFDPAKPIDRRSRKYRVEESSAIMKQDERERSNISSSKSRNGKPTRSFERKHAPIKATEDDSSSPSSKIATRDLYIPIIQESHQVVFINKPPSLLSQPGLPGEGTILDLLRYQRPDLTLQTVNRYISSR